MHHNAHVTEQKTSQPNNTTIINLSTAGNPYRVVDIYCHLFKVKVTIDVRKSSKGSMNSI